MLSFHNKLHNSRTVRGLCFIYIFIYTYQQMLDSAMYRHATAAKSTLCADLGPKWEGVTSLIKKLEQVLDFQYIKNVVMS